MIDTKVQKKRVFLYCILFTSMLVTVIWISNVNSSRSRNKSRGYEDATKIVDASQYDTNEVVVSYTDQTFGFLTYESKEELQNGLLKLAPLDFVDGFQPNYSYETSGEIVSDVNFKKQWALYNDGSFSAASSVDEFPIYKNPFEQPLTEQDIELQNPFQSYAKVFINGLPTDNATEGIDINIEEAWKHYQGGQRETIVAMIDTGVDYNHEEFAQSIWKNEGEIASDGIDNDGNGYVDDIYGWNFCDNSNVVYHGIEDSHGTHGAGTIVAAKDNQIGIAGIVGNSKVKLMILKALGGTQGSGSTTSIIKAIQYAKENGAVICNLSFGTDINDLALKRAIANSGMLFIAAAGNGDNWSGYGVNDDIKPVYPAAYDLDNIISVANLSYDGALHYSSNYGACSVDIAAPGSYILSTTPNNSYSYMTGTSMAAPMVTGVAAMIYSQYSDVTLPQVREMILKSVQPLPNLMNMVACEGMLDANQALNYDYRTLPLVWKNDPLKNMD